MLVQVVIEGAAHMVTMERPAEFNRAVLDFLAMHFPDTSIVVDSPPI
jgi:hypothetical protein